MIEKYAAYTVGDFVKDEDFIEWVQTGRADQPSVWDELLEKYPHQQPVLSRARLIVTQLGEASVASFPKEDAAEIWDNIDNELFVRPLHTEKKPFARSFAAAAASVALLLTLGWAAYQWLVPNKETAYSQLVREVAGSVKEVVNQGQSTMVVILPDSSKVALAPKSKLSYDADFTRKTRDVYLSGEGFFEVVKNPERPFIVYANELVTKVLGTSFNVKAFENDTRVTVAVKTGRVSVFANRHTANVDPETKGIILVPNQQAFFQRESETITRSLVKQPEIVIAKKELEKFSFSNAPVTEIFNAMENAYGVEFLYDQEVLSSCRLTTSLSEETLFEKLDVICEAIGATYKVVDAQVVVSGKGCN